MASVFGYINMDTDTMVNKVKIVCNDLKLLDDFLEKNNLPMRTRRPITRAIWCFEDLLQHLGLEEVASADETLESSLKADPNDLNESALTSPDLRLKKKEAYIPFNDLSEVSKMRLKALKSNQGECRKPSCHKNIETEGSKVTVTTVPYSHSETVKSTEHLQHHQLQAHHQLHRSSIPVKKSEAPRDWSTKMRMSMWRRQRSRKRLAIHWV